MKARAVDHQDAWLRVSVRPGYRWEPALAGEVGDAFEVDDHQRRIFDDEASS
jgi:hypothetical protein